MFFSCKKWLTGQIEEFAKMERKGVHASALALISN